MHEVIKQKQFCVHSFFVLNEETLPGTERPVMRLKISRINLLKPFLFGRIKYCSVLTRQ